MLSKLESGKYILGDMIVPQTFKKVVLTTEGTIKTERVTVTGHKIPLLDIRKNILKEHEEKGLMHLQSDEMTQDEDISELQTKAAGRGSRGRKST